MSDNSIKLTIHYGAEGIDRSVVLSEIIKHFVSEIIENRMQKELGWGRLRRSVSCAERMVGRGAWATWSLHRRERGVFVAPSPA